MGHIVQETLIQKNPSQKKKKKAGVVAQAQGVGTEFKPQYQKRKKIDLHGEHLRKSTSWKSEREKMERGGLEI
jgi:hypothetical protein